MLTVEKVAEDRLDLTLEGQIDGPAMNEALSRLLESAQEIENGKMLYRIIGLAMPTPSAFAVEFGYLPKLFGLVTQFRRCAVLSDTAWLRTAAEIERALFPDLEIKAFSLEQEAQAVAWLEHDEDEDEPGIHSMPV